MKRLMICLTLLLSLSLAAQAAEVSQKTEYGGGYAEISYYATEKDKQEGNALRTEYYNGDALQASKVFTTLEDGTLRTDSLDAGGTLAGYTLYRMVDGKETTQEFDAAGRMVSSHMASGGTAVNTQNTYDPSGALQSSRVVTSGGQGVVRLEDFDNSGALLGYSLETNGRRDTYDAQGKLLEFMMYFVSEDGPYVETYFNPRGEVIRSTMRTTTPEGVTRTVEYDAQHVEVSSIVTRSEGGQMIAEHYDAAGTLVKTEQLSAADDH